MADSAKTFPSTLKRPSSQKNAYKAVDDGLRDTTDPALNCSTGERNSRNCAVLAFLDRWYHIILSPRASISAVPKSPCEVIDIENSQRGWFFKVENALAIRNHGWRHDKCRRIQGFASDRTRFRYRAVLALYFAVWAALFIVLVVFNRYRSMVYDSASGEWVEPTNLGCYSVFDTRPAVAGVNGSALEPFYNQTSFYRCPALCKYANPTNYRYLGIARVPAGTPWVIGGSPFRADSYICQSALQAGLSTNSFGGCFGLQKSGAQSSYPANSAEGLSFYGWFPFSYNLFAVPSSHCIDFGPTVTVPIMFLVSLIAVTLLRPVKGLFVAAMILCGYFTVLYFTDTQWNETFIAEGLGNFILTLFVTYVLYQRFGGHETIPEPLHFAVEWSSLWLPFFFFGLTINLWTIDLVNFTVSSDMFNSPSNTAAFFIGLPILLVIILSQLVVIWRQARLVKFAVAYGLGIALFYVVAAVTGTYTHWHHWFNSLILFPLTNVSWKPSLVYQAFILGMFLNGVARWGFDSPFEASAVQLNDASPVGSAYPLWTFYSNEFSDSSSPAFMTLSWRYFVALDEIPDWVKQQPLPNDPSNPGQIVSPKTNLTTFCTVSSIYPDQFLKQYSLTANGIEIYRGPDCFFNLTRSPVPLGSNPLFFAVAFVSVSNAIMGYSPPLQGYLNGTFTLPSNAAYGSDF